jgi:tetratricopeptide (TPR) repeat protein
MIVNKTYRLGVLFVLAVLASPAAGQSPGLYQQAAKGLSYVYSGYYDSARIAWQPLESNKPLRLLVEAFLLRWKYIPINRYTEGETYATRLASVSESLSKSEGDLYLRVVAEMLQAEYHYTKGEAVQALWHARKAYPLMVKVLDLKTTEPELLFVKGMYLYYMDFFRAKGLIYKTALLPFRDGNQTTGLELLQSVSETGSMASTEASIYLAHIYLHHQNKPEEALPYSEKLVANYPANLKFREVLIENLLVLEKNTAAAEWIKKQVLVSDPYFKMPALYFKGALEKRKGDAASARKTLTECVALASDEELENAFSEKAKELLNEIDK